MTWAIVVASFLGGVAGLFLLSEATFGVGVLAFSILLAVLARMNQADAHHREAMAAREIPPVRAVMSTDAAHR